MSGHPAVRIRYRRPPDGLQIFEQALVLDGDDVKVTFAESIPHEPPMRIDGDVVLERGSDVVWFTFPGAWHDIGRFHRADGSFTGIYANLLTPARMNGTEWETTDLFLDVWIGPDGSVRLLDEDEFDRAVENAWIDAATARRAREEAHALLAAAGRGSWPPPIVHEWTRERCREVLGRRTDASGADTPVKD